MAMVPIVSNCHRYCAIAGKLYNIKYSPRASEQPKSAVLSEQAIGA